MPQTLPSAVSSALEYEDFFSTTISEDLAAGDTDIYIDEMPISTNSFLVIDPDGEQPEIIYFNEVGGNYVRCPSATNGEGRGVFQTDPQDWPAGTVIGMFSTAAFFEAIASGVAMRGAFFTPTGVVSAYAGAAAPDGWLLCDGSSVLQADYADLFGLIGTTYGPSDATHFTLPDMRGRLPLGAGARTWAVSFLAAAVDATANQIAITANNNVFTGKAVVLTTTSGAPAGLTASNTYYIIVVDSTHISLATTLANAIDGVVIDITTQGAGTHTLTFTGTTHNLADTGGEDKHALVIAETPSHRHSLSMNASATAGGIAQYYAGNGAGSSAPTTSFVGGDTTHNVLNPYTSLNYIIKV